MISNNYYHLYTTDTDTVLGQPLFEINSSGTYSNGSNITREFTGYVDLELTTQRSTTDMWTSSQNNFTAKLYFSFCYNHEDSAWESEYVFIQENKVVDSDIPYYQGLNSMPQFKYKKDNSTKKLQVYIEFTIRRCRLNTGYTVRVTSDSPSDVTIPGSLMNYGTEVTAVLGLGYKHNGHVGIGTTNPQAQLEIYDSETTAYGNGFRITRYNPNTSSTGVSQGIKIWRYHIGRSDLNDEDDDGFTDGIMYIQWYNSGNLSLCGGGGYVGIGNGSPTCELDVTGDIRASGDITAYYSSDKRLKENLKKIENPLEKIEKSMVIRLTGKN